MTAITPQKEIVATYFGFLDTLGERLRSGGQGDVGAAPLLDRLPGLRSLFLTFPVVSETNRLVAARTVEDWNPLGQRLLLPAATPVPASAFETDFALLTMAAQSLVEWAHEAVHILAVEPWCTGQRDLSDEAGLTRWYLASEALAFWYAEIVVTRAIREHVPQAELVYSRSSVSNSGFHPEEAFRRLGVTDLGDTLRLYVNAFLGSAPDMANTADPLAAQYGRKLQEFYRGGRVGLGRLHRVLEQCDLAGYWTRYCRRVALPSLLGRALPTDVAPAIFEIGTQVLPALAAMDRDRLEAVLLRRMAQVRAYHGWMLRVALRRGWVFSEGSLDIAALLSSIEIYLESMDAALDALCVGSLAHAREVIDFADVAYEAELRTPLQAVEARTRYRYWVFPFFAPTGGLVGLWDSRTDYSANEAEAVLRFVSERCEWDRERIAVLARALTALESGDSDRARTRFNEFLTHRTVRNCWSTDLGGLSPRDGRFREILFEFH